MLVSSSPPFSPFSGFFRCVLPFAYFVGFSQSFNFFISCHYTLTMSEDRQGPTNKTHWFAKIISSTPQNSQPASSCLSDILPQKRPSASPQHPKWKIFNGPSNWKTRTKRIQYNLIWIDMISESVVLGELLIFWILDKNSFKRSNN